MTNPATTIEDVMDLIYQSQDAVLSLMPFDGGYSNRLKHCGELHDGIKSALTTLIAERDQAVREAADERDENKTHCGCEFEECTVEENCITQMKSKVVCLFHQSILDERDIALAEVERLKKFWTMF